MGSGLSSEVVVAVELGYADVEDGGDDCRR